MKTTSWEATRAARTDITPEQRANAHAEHTAQGRRVSQGRGQADADVRGHAVEEIAIRLTRKGVRASYRHSGGGSGPSYVDRSPAAGHFEYALTTAAPPALNGESGGRTPWCPRRASPERPRRRQRRQACRGKRFGSAAIRRGDVHGPFPGRGLWDPSCTGGVGRSSSRRARGVRSGPNVSRKRPGTVSTSRHQQLSASPRCHRRSHIGTVLEMPGRHRLRYHAQN